jgi:hypothetical protein
MSWLGHVELREQLRAEAEKRQTDQQVIKTSNQKQPEVEVPRHLSATPS